MSKKRKAKRGGAKLSREVKFRPCFLKQWRKFRDMSQDDLAAAMGMSPGNLSNIETGKQPYTQKNLESGADALRCTVAELITRDPTKPADVYTLLDTASDEQKDQAADLLRVLLRRGAA